jgi:hypothetical protein
MQPDFEQLLQIIRVAAQSTPLEFVRVVLASKEGDVSFLEVTEGADFRSALASFVAEGFLALGLLGWQLERKQFQAKSFLFPWHAEEPRLCALFKRLCEHGVDSVKEEFDRRSVN